MTAQGRQMGVYRLHERIGAGGMGEVYRAHDARLGRDVAIKILPAEMTDAPGYRERFEREARALAALNHPHIAAIYGVERTTDAGPPIRGLVLELVHGETLGERIARGPIPVKESLSVAARIADALEAAHEKGIIHRDLNPANIRLTPGGVVKVLDFGLAKVADPSPPVPAMTQATTLAAPVSAGLILGTAPYMSPEQARAADVNEQTDIWAFGCVLYEMLAGRPAFGRGSRTDTLAAILERDPDWSALPRATPPLVVRALQRCLEKDPRQRTRHIADVRLDLEDALSSPPAAVSGGPSNGVARGRRAPMAIGIAAGVVLATALWMWSRSAPRPADATRLSLSVEGTLTPQTSVAVSPDGRRVAYVSTDASGRSMLWVRELSSLEPRVLTGTEDAAHPFWSPDGESLGFLAGGKVKRVDLDGGAVLTLADTNTRSGASWSRSGVILFSPRVHELATVPAGGGPVSTVLTRAGISWPFFLPDGRHFLVTVPGDEPAARGLHVGALDSDETTRLLDTDFKGAYTAGYLLVVRGETLMAQPFDADRRELSGEPVPVAEGIWGAPAAAQASFSASDAGVLAYVNSSLQDRELAWIDRSGRSLGSVARPDRYGVIPELAPDGARIAIARGPGNDDVWVIDAGDGSSSRVTFDPAVENAPKWGTSGRRILYQAFTAPSHTLLSTELDRSAPPAIVATLARNSYLWDWSRDERFVVFSRFGTQLAADLWVLPMTGDRTPYAFAESRFHKTQAQISPNGRWLAYTSYESGRDEVYVESFPKPGNRRQISVDGGMQPRWRPDGGELFYLQRDQHLMAVPLAADQAPSGPPKALFRTRLLPQGSQSVWFDTAYDVTADGQRFLMTGPPGEPRPPITIVLNWLASVRK